MGQNKEFKPDEDGYKLLIIMLIILAFVSLGFWDLLGRPAIL
jgi:hypothetical protein